MTTRHAFAFLSGGLRLAGDLYLPKARPAAGHPGVVVASGFGGVKEMLLPDLCQALADAGVAALAFDYPNFGASEGPRRQHIDIAAQRRSYRDALAALACDERLDAGRLGVWGPSLAGGHALQVAARDPQVRSALGIVPFIRLPLDRPDVPVAVEVVKDVLGRVLLRRPGRMTPIAGPPGTLAAMTTDGAQEWIADAAAAAPTFRNEVTSASLPVMLTWSTAADARRIRVPLRVILAEDDRITPAAMVRKAVRDVPGVDVVSFPQTHFELLTTHYDEVRALLVDWFTRTL